MSESNNHKTVLFVSNDLMFASKVKHAAISQNLEFKSANGLESVRQVLESNDRDISLIVFDLVAVADSIDKLAPIAQSHQVSTIAYAPHVQTDMIESATRIGIQKVFTRGQFNRDVAAILSEYV